MKSSRSRRRLQHEIDEIVAAYHRSGLSQSAYCECEGLSLSTLSNWLSKARKGRTRQPAKHSSGESQFVPVKLVDDCRSQSCGTLEVESARGYLLRVPAGIEPELLARYVHALEERC